MSCPLNAAFLFSLLSLVACAPGESSGAGAAEAGDSASPRPLEMLPPAPRIIAENFVDDAMLDRRRSSGAWANGEGIFGRLGGDGRHGDLCIPDGVELLVLDTDSGQVFDPRGNARLRGDAAVVEDGVFQFSSLHIAPGKTLRLKGSKPAQILVRGECRIEGILDASGVDLQGPWDGKKFFGGLPRPRPQPGEPGGEGGPGGGRGGDGAYGADGVSPTLAIFNLFRGYPGEDLRLLPGARYGGLVTGSGGEGGPLVPPTGKRSAVEFTTPLPAAFPVPQDKFSQYIASGGGGGGFKSPGMAGAAIQNGHKTDLFGPISPIVPIPSFFGLEPSIPGGSDTSLPLSRTPGSTAFLIGGSGGGGGGCHALFARESQLGSIEDVLFNSGAAGAGGGGVIALRVGAALQVGMNAEIAVRGGSAGDQSREPAGFGAPWPNGIASPGGGGSGGSLLVQVDGAFQQDGVLDVSGGKAGVARLDLPALGQNSKYVYHTRGGDGSPGQVRIEVREGSLDPARMGRVLPDDASELLRLEDESERSGFQSLWYQTGEVTPPRFLRYEIDVIVDGRAVTYSDDPRFGFPAAEGQSPIIFFVQGLRLPQAEASASAAPDPDRLGPWRRQVGRNFGPIGESLDEDGVSAFRWLLLRDGAMGVHELAVQALRIFLEAA